MRTPLFAANWKMNKLVKEVTPFFQALQETLKDVKGDYDVMIAPPATHLTSVPKGSAFHLGSQNCGTTKFGAFTAEISPVVLKELGCQWVIVGHSERRHIYKEDDGLVLARMKAGLTEGLKVVLCVGETLQERKAGKTSNVVETQLAILSKAWDRVVIAYEPVWAIGTGENATPEQAEEVHSFIRGWVTQRTSANVANELRILYGGSVKPENSQALMAQKNVDGFLVGGASLDPVIFAGVIRNGLKSRL